MKRYRISEMAKELGVENHVLRYWEEELQLKAKRNELGHRYYTEEDLKIYKEIKRLKESGVQLKGIKNILSDTKDIAEIQLPEQKKEISVDFKSDQQETKQIKLQSLLQMLIQDAVNQSNQLLIDELKDSLLKEIDYQFRQLMDEQEKLHQEDLLLQEKYFEKIDQSIQKEYGNKSKKRFFMFKNKVIQE